MLENKYNKLSSVDFKHIFVHYNTIYFSADTYAPGAENKSAIY